MKLTKLSKSIIFLGFVLVQQFVLTGCGQKTPSDNDTSPVLVNANSVLEWTDNDAILKQKHISYFKDKFDICYAVVRFSTYSVNDGISFTSVPCDKVKL